MEKTIGIPRAFLYYRYKILWKTFFRNLGFKLIVSDKTTKQTIGIGKKYSIDESCLASKIYIGHVYNLLNKCDYILIPRVCNYGKEENVCVKFNANYDIIKNTFTNIKIIDYNIEKTKKSPESIALIKLGIKLTKRPIKVLISYFKAITTAKKIEQKKIINQQKKLTTSNLKVLVVSHPYNIYDNYIGQPIIKKLEKEKIEVIYSDLTNKLLAKKYAKKLSPTLYWTYSKELIGSIEYYKEYINGIIFLTTFPCGPDSLVNELMIRKITTIPTLNIIIDDMYSETGIDTRIESFVDILKERSDKY